MWASGGEGIDGILDPVTFPFFGRIHAWREGEGFPGGGCGLGVGLEGIIVVELVGCVFIGCWGREWFPGGGGHKSGEG